jgi:hypothetical protein
MLPVLRLRAMCCSSRRNNTTYPYNLLSTELNCPRRFSTSHSIGPNESNCRVQDLDTGDWYSPFEFGQGRRVWWSRPAVERHRFFTQDQAALGAAPYNYGVYDGDGWVTMVVPGEGSTGSFPSKPPPLRPAWPSFYNNKGQPQVPIPRG